MIRHLTAIAAIICMYSLNSACKKSTNSTPPKPIDSTVVYPDYFALKQGNYWIYQQFKVTDSGTEQLNTFDSSFVGSDTTINNKIYHTWFLPAGLGGSTSFTWVRDSLGYVVDFAGNIHFSNSDFSTIFATRISYPNGAHPDTITVTNQMGFRDSMVTVPAGTFKTATFRNVYHFLPGYQIFGPTREYDWMYAQNIGLIKATAGWYSISSDIYEWRLIRYHIQ